ncbi:hypothetical protein MKW92_001659 [Papaver armeniacum]|nr:hypothetical protein MKW92_001659 [Papaver armeniacum]
MENMDVPFQSAANARTAANRTRPSFRHRDSASKRRFEDYQEARGSNKRNKSDGSDKNTSKQWVYNFRRHPELPIVISDDESDNDEGYQNPGDSAKHDVTEKIEQNRQVINSDSECDEERPMPTQHRSASHKRKCKIPKKASCAARKVDVSGTKSAMRVMEEAKAFKSDFPTCIIIMKQSYSNKGSPVHVPNDFTRNFLIKAESAKPNDSEDIENDGGRTMPTQTKSATARHGGKHKISKTSEVKVHCPGVSERKSQRAMGVIKEDRAFKSDYPICTIIVQPSYMRKGSTVVCFATTPNCLTLNFTIFC